MQEDDDLLEERTITPSQNRLLILIATLTLGSLAYRLIVLHHLEQTSLLFIGLPALMAAVLALVPPAKSLTGGVLRGITLFLLLSGPVLGEGFICVLMAAPIFLAIGLLVGLVMQRDRERRRATMGCCLLVLILPMTLEGTTGTLSFNRFERVTQTAIVHGTPEQVRARMAQSPRLDLKLPPLFRMGFPHPTQAIGEGLTPGDLRRIHFEGGEGKPGDLVFRVAASTPTSARFVVQSDGCEGMHSIGHWVTLREAEVHWTPIDADHTRVTWQIAFERRLDPAWYFGPWERYAGRLAARYLIDANAGPR